MDAGKRGYHTRALEVKLTNVQSTIPNYWFSNTAVGRITSYQTQTVNSLDTGIRLNVLNTASYYGSSTVATLDIPLLSISRSTTYGSWQQNLTSRVEVDTIIYAYKEFCWLTYVDTIRWYLNGTLVYTTSPHVTLSSTSYNRPMAPSSIPLFGVDPVIEENAYSSVSYDEYTGTPATATVSGTINGGWQFREGWSGTTWNNLPIYYQVKAVSPPIGCPLTPVLPSVTITNTYDASIPCNAKGAISGSMMSMVVDSRATWVKIGLLPDLVKKITRLNTDYGALWFRYGCPQYKAWTIAGSAPYSPLPPPGGTTVYEEWIPLYEGMLSRVTNAYHTIEDLLAEHTIAPYDIGETLQQIGGANWYASLRSAFPKVGTEPTLRCTYLDHTYAYASTDGDHADYLNHLAHGHWAYFYFFPAYNSENPSADDWEVDSVAMDPELYWLPIHQQYMHNTALPIGEDTHQRNFICESPLLDGGFSDLIKTYFFANAKTHWVGIPKFTTIVPSIPSSLTIDSGSTSLWTATDCSIAHGTSMTVTPSGGHTSIVIEYDLGSYTVSPYQLLHIADQVKVNWQLTNISQVKVYLVSVDTTSKLLLENSPGDGYTTRNITYDITNSVDAKYAGSYAQDRGVGFVSDLGTDELVTGISSTLLASSEYVNAFCLLAGKQPAKVRFEITLTSASACTIEYPIFYFTKDLTVLQENGHWADLLYEDGPGIRLGQLSWWDGSTLRTTPLVMDLGSQFTVGYRQTALDALVNKRVFLEGIKNDSGLNAEIASIYDSTEGNTQAAIDSFAYAFHLHKEGTRTGAIALVNSFATVPPLALFPIKELNSNYEETGDYSQINYSLCQLPRRIVSNQQIDLYSASSKWTGASSVSVPGWVITEHSSIVDNTETDFELRTVDATIAKVRPWWGEFILIALTEVLAGKGIAVCHSSHGAFWLAYVSDGNVFVNRANYVCPKGSWDSSVQVTDSNDCSDVGITFSAGYLYLEYTKAGTSYRRVSTDYGVTFRAEEVVMAGGLLNRIHANKYGDRISINFAYDSGTSGSGKLYVEKKKRGDTSWSSATPVLNSSGVALSVTDDGFDFSYANGKWILSAVKYGDTAKTVFVSNDSLSSVVEC